LALLNGNSLTFDLTQDSDPPLVRDPLHSVQSSVGASEGFRVTQDGHLGILGQKSLSPVFHANIVAHCWVCVGVGGVGNRNNEFAMSESKLDSKSTESIHT
jgi:hypothetical protein